MITICSCCNQDSAGNHEWGCPCSPKTYPGKQADDVVASLYQRIATLEAQLAAVTAENTRLAAEWTQCHEQNGRLVSEHYALRATLKTVAEVAQILVASFYGKVGIAYGSEIRALQHALATPLVREVLAEKGGDADGKEEVR